MTFDPSNALHFGRGFFPNLVAIWHCQANWPLHDIWPQQCITLRSGVLPTKYGGHRALLSKLTHTWPQLTHTWPSTQAMHFSLVSNSSHQIWWLKGISKQLTPGWPQMTPAWPLTPAMHYALVRGSFHQIWWPKGICKADWPLDDLWP